MWYLNNTPMHYLFFTDFKFVSFNAYMASPLDVLILYVTFRVMDMFIIFFQLKLTFSTLYLNTILGPFFFIFVLG